MAAVKTIINDVAQSILDAVVAGVDDPPSRQFVADAEPAFDCELVAVQFVYLAQGLPGRELVEPSKAGVPRHAAYRVWIARCVPTLDEDGAAPTPTQISTSARALQTDAWQMVLAIHESDLKGSCKSVLVQRVSALASEGAFAGNQLDLMVQI